MMHSLPWLVASALVVAFSTHPPARLHAGEPAPRQSAQLEFFEKKIRPLLVDNCYTCHSADTNSKGGLRVDDRNGLVIGGDGGPAVVPGDPEKSLLIRAVRYADKKLQMPPKKRLSDEQVADLVRWIAEGAAWPNAELPADLNASTEEYKKKRREHWAWQPLADPTPPSPQKQNWAHDDVDRFVFAKLEAANLQPNGDVDDLTFIRRVTFDLTGLPPTPAEMADFTTDKSATARETLVDRLLASPAFGERWGRHWLDLARYAESSGPSRNMPYPHAWRYRDYVIDAFNVDKPYDEFVREQIAGDLLPASSAAERDRLQIATGFLALGGKDVNQRFKIRFIMDNVDEQIDTVTRSILALTASCARCHDHKYDPIPTTEYYALAGIFQSTELCVSLRSKMGGGGYDYYDTDMLLRLSGNQASSAGEEKIVATKKALAEARSDLVKLRDDPDSLKARGAEGQEALKALRKKIDEIQAELVKLTDPARNGPVAYGVREGKTIADTQIRIRGEAEKWGPVVPRGFLTVVPPSLSAPIGSDRSGRLELAQWLTDPRNPLTSRVIVNRVWHYLFGRGLVQTVDNFGVTGDGPSHPELLDYLARRFVCDGWSIKRLVRTLVLCRTYGLSAETSAEHLAIDPSNRLLWRHAPRRLQAEEIRDAVLAASGELDLARPHASPAAALPVVELRDTDAGAKQLLKAARSDRHRSIYLPLLRGLTPTSLDVFDFAQQSLVTGNRETTTVATQALYLLNDPFILEQASTLAEIVLKESGRSEAERIDELYRRLLGRAATADEQRRATTFIREYQAELQRQNAGKTDVAGKKTGPVKKKTAKLDPTTIAKTGSGVAEVPVIATVANPDNIDRSVESVIETAAISADPRTAAWAGLAQAVIASAEFRYVR
jgi:cytochrome c553